MAKTIHLKDYTMKWNIKDIAFLYPPDVFTGAFDNEILEARHRKEMQLKLANLKKDLAKEEDPIAAMRMLHKKDHVQFLCNNVERFREAGRLEEGVITLYTQLNTPFSSDGQAELWNRLFTACDRKRLYDYGEPISFTRATVYRGSVSGFTQSLLWTPEKSTAERMAARWQDPALCGGEMYQVDIAREDVLVFLKLRRGDELILTPECLSSAQIRTYKAVE